MAAKGGAEAGSQAKFKYDARVNFCGGAGGPGVPNQAGSASINQACFVHDVCYSSSGIPKKASCDAPPVVKSLSNAQTEGIAEQFASSWAGYISALSRSTCDFCRASFCSYYEF